MDYVLELHIDYTDPRSDKCITWCNENVGIEGDDWEWRWYDGGQHGWHEFWFKDQADLLIFRIVNGV